VIAALGEVGPYLVTGGMFALASVSLLGLPKSLAKAPESSVRKPSFGEELREGFRLIRADRWLSLAIRQLTLTQAIVCVILTLAPALSLALLHRPLQQASQYLIIPAGLGMVFGVVIVGRITRRWSKIRVLEVGLIVAGSALALLGLSGLLYQPHEGRLILPLGAIAPIVAVLVFGLGMLNAIISSTAQTVLQENSSEEGRGKLFGALNMYINIAATLPILLTGALADLLSVTRVVTVMGLGVVIFAVMQLLQLRRRGLHTEQRPA
jgi:MFS family permease